MNNEFSANIWKMYVFKFLSNLHFMGGVLIPFFVDWGHISFAQIMFLQSWFMLWVFILEIPTGTVADFLGRKTSLAFGALMMVAGIFIYTSSPDFFVFLLAEFVWAISAALVSGADEAFVFDTLKKMDLTGRAKKLFARLESFKLAGIMISAPIGSLIAVYFGLRMPMLVMAIPVTLAFLLSLTFREPKTEKSSESTRYIDILKRGVKFFYHNRVLQILALDMVAVASIGYFMIWLCQPMLQKAGVPIIYFGIVQAMLVLSEIVLMNSYPWLEKILRYKKRVIFYSALFTGLAFILGGLTDYLPLVLVAIMVGGGFGLSRGPLFSSYLNQHIPSGERATVLSTIAMFRQLVLVVINPLVGYAVDWSLNYTLIILGLIGVVFSFVSRVKEEHLIEQRKQVVV